MRNDKNFKAPNIFYIGTLAVIGFDVFLNLIGLEKRYVVVLTMRHIFCNYVQ